MQHHFFYLLLHNDIGYWCDVTGYAIEFHALRLSKAPAKKVIRTFLGYQSFCIPFRMAAPMQDGYHVRFRCRYIYIYIYIEMCKNYVINKGNEITG